MVEGAQKKKHLVTDHAQSDIEKEIVRQKTARFLQWCDDVGILYPKIEYPAFFEGGLVGMKVKEKIQHREAFLYVPLNVIISTDKCLADPVIGPVFSEHKDIFTDEHNDWEQLLLTVFIMYQKQLGEKSFWAPYIDLMPNVTFFCDLPLDEIRNTADPYIISELKEYKEELEEEFYQVIECLSKYKHIFTEQTLQRSNFMSIYAQVCSRCFGWGLPATSMIPLADSINHSDVNVFFELINKRLHLEGDEASTYFTKVKFMGDYSAIIDQKDITSKSERLNVIGRFDRISFQLNQEEESYENIQNQLQEKQCWQVEHYIWDRYHEDNDTEEEDLDSELEKLQIALEKASFDSLYTCLEEKRIPQNHYPLVLRKFREYIQPEDTPYTATQTKEKEFKWYDSKVHDKETYFAMINVNRRDLQPGEQAFYCYGQRSNKFLLVHYGFCFADNKYDSFEFNLFTKFKQSIIPLMVCMKPNTYPVQRIRLKTDQINEMMLFYLRCKLPKGHTQTWVEFELKCLEFYEKIIEYLYTNQEMWGSLETDLDQLKGADLTWGMRMAITYRVERFKILNNQKLMVKWVRSIVENAHDAVKQGQFRELALRQTEEESELEKTLDSTKFKLGVQRRRLINANYLKYVYQKVQVN